MKTQVHSLTLVAAAFTLFAPVTRAADTYKIDPVHSSVLFKVRHLDVTNFYGRFNDISGTIVFDKQDPSKTSMELTVPVESVDTNNEKRTQHLKSPDFFNAKQFPVITFKSNKVEKTGDDTFAVTGDFTLHGVTKAVTVNFEKIGEGEGMQGEHRAGGEVRFTIKRSDYGMNFMIGAVGDEVKVILAVEGIRQ